MNNLTSYAQSFDTSPKREGLFSSIKLWNSLPDDYIDIDNFEALPAVNISLYC